MKLLLASLLSLGILLFLTSCGEVINEATPTALVTVQIPAPARDYASHQHAGDALTIYYQENAQVELVGPVGNRILVDVYDPSKLSRPASISDVLLTTHDHPENVNASFLSNFPGQQLYRKAGSLQWAEVNIQSIPSAHNASDPLLAENGSNYIYVIDIAGLRIAHFGDIGQESLTEEQLQALGKVDVAITQFDNPLSDMSVENRKGFHLMEQVKPRLIIPTHVSEAAGKELACQWACFYSTQSSITLDSANLSQETQVLLMGSSADKIGKLVNAQMVEW